MTPKQRVRAALERKPVDRIPVFPVVTSYLGSRVLGRPYRDLVLDPELVHEGLRAIHARFSLDGFEIGLSPSVTATAPRTSTVDGATYLVNDDGRPIARLADDDMPVALQNDPILSNKSNLDKIGITPASWYIEHGCTRSVAEIVRDLGDSAFIAGVAAGQTMNALAAWRGSEQAMLDLYEDPVFVHEAMSRATDISVEVGKALVYAGVDAIYIGDAWASASIISPAMYEEYCQPYHARAAHVFHEAGAKVYLHICGDSAPLLELMADTGVDAIEPLDVDAGVDLSEVKGRVGNRVCLKGGLSTQLLLRGTPDEVYAEAQRCIRILGPTSYILGSADDIPRDTPFENIDAMVRAAAETIV